LEETPYQLFYHGDYKQRMLVMLHWSGKMDSRVLRNMEYLSGTGYHDFKKTYLEQGLMLS